MTNTNVLSLFPSRFLKKEHFPEPALLTITGWEVMNVAPEGQSEDRKPVLYLKERDEGFVLNQTNATDMALMFETPNIDEWIGKRVELFHDPSIKFGHQRVGGIRTRKPTEDDHQEGDA